MIPNPMLMLAVVLAFVANGFYWNAHGANSENTRWKAKTFQELAASSEAARKQESMWQGVVNETAKNYQGKVDGIRRNRDIALDSLRARPERADPAAGASGSASTCGTGAILCREDGEFLTREAARADEIRAGLEACYKVIDGTK